MSSLGRKAMRRRSADAGFNSDHPGYQMLIVAVQMATKAMEHMEKGEFGKYETLQKYAAHYRQELKETLLFFEEDAH